MMQIAANEYVSLCAAVALVGCASQVDRKDIVESNGPSAAAIHSFATEAGQVFDCIDRETQPALRDANGSLRPLRRPPSASRALDMSSTPFDGKLDLNGNVRRCPDGTVPIVRLSEKTKSALERWGGLPKGRPTVADPAVNGHDHAVFKFDNIVYSAPQWIMSLQVPSVPSNAAFSLSQTWVSGGSRYGTKFCPNGCTTGVDCIQTLEVGLQVYPQLWGNSQPHLFIFTTNDGYNTSCYSRVSCAAFPDPWVQYSSDFAPGTQLVLPSCNYPEWVMSWSYDADIHGDPTQGTWWLQIQGVWVGYYPSNWFGTSVDNPTDMEDGGGTFFEAGGEVANLSFDGTFQMGSGTPGSSGFSATPNAAYFRKLEVNGGPLSGTAIQTNPTSFSVGQSSPGSSFISPGNTCAGANGDNAWTDWGTYFYYGGTGGLSNQPTTCN